MNNQPPPPPPFIVITRVMHLGFGLENNLKVYFYTILKVAILCYFVNYDFMMSH